MKERGKILAIDDDRLGLKLLESYLKDSPFQVTAVGDPEEALSLLEEDDYDLVLSDIQMPVLDGFEVMKRVNQDYPGLPVIMITAHGTISDAVRAIQKGAYDYLTKPINPQELILKARRAIGHYRLWRDNQSLKQELAAQYGIENIIGHSKPMREIFRKIAKVAPTNASVLIMGESGTGKELAARAIHYNSPRKDQPFIPVDCASIPHTLLESELFGHAKGAFTGAYKDRPGAFENAGGGTLFFDEIGDMDISLQSTLLRAIQERVFKRVGENNTRRLEARLLFGTHINLMEAMERSEFREDLYYRISVIPIKLPPLRDRRADIPLLVNHFLVDTCRRHGIPQKTIEMELVDAMVMAPWKGNVRELENYIENLIVMSDGDSIRIKDAPRFSGSESADNQIGPAGIPDRSLADIEKEYILRVLEAEGGNRTRTAEILGISLRGLRYKLKAYAEDDRT
ncbi:MAG TPA: sigma-54-dependent Fis family transcriptional regulator [Proteobacteria bacterium]|nr:sigma-54-dependent Fis family transcriptional regulator [Pseudomonadota bacterium]